MVFCYSGPATKTLLLCPGRLPHPQPGHEVRTWSGRGPGGSRNGCKGGKGVWEWAGKRISGRGELPQPLRPETQREEGLVESPGLGLPTGSWGQGRGCGQRCCLKLGVRRNTQTSLLFLPHPFLPHLSLGEPSQQPVGRGVWGVSFAL